AIAIHKQGFVPYFFQVEVKKGEVAKLDAALVARKPAEGEDYGFVFVNIAPTGAEIRVDGARSGRHTPSQLELTIGKHTVAVWSAGKLIARESILVQSNQVVQFHPDAPQLP
ncbi:MAG: PEGA domain-containing protein, partial [Bryobacteraceae bacterium]